MTYARVGARGREDRHGVVVRDEVDDDGRRHGLSAPVSRRHEQLKLRVDLVAEGHGRVDDHLRTERSSGTVTVALEFSRSLKTFRLTFLRMLNKCKIISVQRNNKAFSA